MKNNVLTKVKNGAKKVGNVVVNTGKVCVAAVAAGAMIETTFSGLIAEEGDAKLFVRTVKHKIAPTPVYTKKGVFGKKEISTINPITKEVEPYKGKKLPDTNKVIKLK